MNHMIVSVSLCMPVKCTFFFFFYHLFHSFAYLLSCNCHSIGVLSKKAEPSGEISIASLSLSWN